MRRVGDQRTVVTACAAAIVVYIGATHRHSGQRDRVTRVAHTVVIDVPLQGIRNVGAVVVGSVGAPLAVGREQPRHGAHAIAVRVGLGHSATVRINRCSGCSAGTQITCICNAVVVSIRQATIDGDAAMLRIRPC